MPAPERLPATSSNPEPPYPPASRACSVRRSSATNKSSPAPPAPNSHPESDPLHPASADNSVAAFHTAKSPCSTEPHASAQRPLLSCASPAPPDTHPYLQPAHRQPSSHASDPAKQSTPHRHPYPTPRDNPHESSPTRPTAPSPHLSAAHTHRSPPQSGTAQPYRHNPAAYSFARRRQSPQCEAYRSHQAPSSMQERSSHPRSESYVGSAYRSSNSSPFLSRRS